MSHETNELHVNPIQKIALFNTWQQIVHLHEWRQISFYPFLDDQFLLVAEKPIYLNQNEEESSQAKRFKNEAISRVGSQNIHILRVRSQWLNENQQAVQWQKRCLFPISVHCSLSNRKIQEIIQKIHEILDDSVPIDLIICDDDSTLTSIEIGNQLPKLKLPSNENSLLK